VVDDVERESLAGEPVDAPADRDDVLVRVGTGDRLGDLSERAALQLLV
jgi:hypothetical protein